MYGDPGNPCRAPAGKPIGHAEEERIRQGWIVGAQESAARCRVRVDGMIAGAVFVAAGERSPRAKELVAHECGAFNEEEREGKSRSEEAPTALVQRNAKIQVGTTNTRARRAPR